MFARSARTTLRTFRHIPHPVLRPSQITTRNAHIRFNLPQQGGNYQRFNNRRPFTQLWGNPNFKKVVGVGTAGAVTFYVYNLETVPVSGRRRFNVVSIESEMQLSQQMYEETVRQFHGRILPPNHPTTRRVRRVLERLIPASGLQDLDWEVNVIADNSIKNAFVIPGGKVFVFSGILPICGNDDGLAAVMSHEIAHTVAHHFGERMSSNLLVFVALILGGIALGDVDSVSRVGNTLLDLAYLRPGSRKQESEADYIGLMMMAEACYNPDAAVTLWQRMDAAEKVAVPQFLSTHPTNSRRIEDITKWLPEAREKQQISQCGSEMPKYANEFTRVMSGGFW
ncbi:peptidase family M48-domain-containing protein [Pyronema domesticum]|uniref:Similar to Mitochondrial metalloendopeptidase OMA1 acc. no. Q9P7G4 n=1 Tax=Pyronema omphalodes (strain CBS 100304) TaxID=1076935 RepID=U4LAP1_PYROM|nr:peptidase family M48-domain-containing protein [Pyronema domesticum]CCX16186.1 Similar to Mitochondrial metalloendopeptidase OMA1; acc. no. Q9P7G4 [Pyronema omphalodes CBS 100304]